LELNSPHSLKEWVGKQIGVTDWLFVTQERIDDFSEATEDRQWIHLDRERTIKESPYGTTIAHGFLTLSMISHFVREVIHFQNHVRLAVNYGLNRVRFPAPVPVESRIRGNIGLQAFKDFSDSVEAIYAITIERENSEKPGCVAEWIIRYYL
jgi:acyl dehydratase